MFYRYSLTVPASTSQAAPVQATMHLSYGIVHHIEIGFPPGCAALVHACIWRFEHQVWPTNPEEYFAWDDYNVIIRDEDYPLTEAPYLMFFRAWSEDTSYQHTIVARVGIKLPNPHNPGHWTPRFERVGGVI